MPFASPFSSSCITAKARCIRSSICCSNIDEEVELLVLLGKEQERSTMEYAVRWRR
uniref:Uncharacterized protein n=1 Tax=Arundo donax TaxID=35708 RepID=A0A0A9FM25_ARUDO